MTTREECRLTRRGKVSERRDSRRILILKAADDWPVKFLACLGAWSGNIPRPKQQRVRDLRDPFV